MTILLTKCPHCDSNFMLLNTEMSKGECVACGKEQAFNEKEISEAETRRDSLSEQYIGRLEKAYGDKDREKMSSLAEEVANAGISSWYAWFCVGWSDLQEGRTGPAFDDFKLAALFLDEENFDEFYELAMDAVLESIEDAAREDKDWSTEDTTLVDFTGALFERFEHLCEQDFMCDLILRLGTLSDSIETARMGASLIKEIMMIVMDYMSGNLFVEDRQNLLNNAKSSIDSVDEAMQAKAQDGSMAPNTVKIWGSGFSEFLQMLIEGGDKIVAQYSDEEMFSLCEYWGVNDYEAVFGLLQNAFEFHLGFMMSGKRNKGIQKKRDKALSDYETAFRKPLDEGLTSEMEEGALDYDRICPDCGKYLIADEDGVIKCECGFKSRIATADIDDLPENVPELVMMGRKAFLDRDPKMLNNIGERILEFDENNWYGFVSLASSCAIDGQIGESIMLFTQASEHLDQKDRKEFRDCLLDILSESIMSGDPDPMSMMFMHVLFEALDRSPAKDCNISLALVDRVSKASFDDSVKGFQASMMVNPVFSFEIMHSTSLRHLKETCSKLLDLVDAIRTGNDSIKKDSSNLKQDVSDYVRTYNDLLRHMMSSIDGRTAGMNDEKIGYLAGHWAASMDAYSDMASKVNEAMFEDDDAPYNPKSNSIMKAKHAIDRFLDDYLMSS